jgi:hypothetical protein
MINIVNRSDNGSEIDASNSRGMRFWSSKLIGDEPPRIGGERKLQILKWGAAYYFQFIREVFLWK